MSEKGWLQRAPAIAGGLNSCALKFDTWKNWQWDDNESEADNLALARRLHDDFLDEDTLIRRAFNKWLVLPHPTLGVRYDSRRYSVLKISFRTMLTCMSYEYTAYLLARFGNEEEAALGAEALGEGVELYDLLIFAVERAIAGEVDDMEAVMQWAADVGDCAKPLEQFEADYAMLGSKLRAEAGFKSNW